MYRPRNPEASPFFRLVREHFDEFERVYAERFQPKYGYWRPVIGTAIDKYVKCGDLREGFARVSHQQWVLTIPKRLRIFFRYDRQLLGKLCRLAYETIRDSLSQSCGAQEGEPGYVGAIQT